MARTRHRHRRNPSRNQWIAIGVGTAIVLTGGTILIVHRRHRAIMTGGGGDTQGAGGSGSSGQRQFKGELDWLCKQPGTLPPAKQQILINGVFVPEMNRAFAKLPAGPTIPQINGMIVSVAESVLAQTCQQPGPATRAMAMTLSHDAWLKTSGQG